LAAELMADQAAGNAGDLGGLALVDHHCHSLLGTWATAGGSPPGWRRCFTEARRPVSLARDVPGLLGYRHFLAAMADRLGLDPAEPGELEARVLARRDQLAAADAGGWLRGLLDDAGTAALLVDTGFGGPEMLPAAELGRAAARPARPVARVESIVEELLRDGAGRGRLDGFVDRVQARLHAAVDGGAVALKSVVAYRAGLALPDHGDGDRRRAFRALGAGQAGRFDDPVLGPYVLRLAANVAAGRRVPLQVHTGFGDEDLHLPAADPSLLRPLFRDPRTEGCTVVLLHCHPFADRAAYLAGTYPQVFMDLSLTIPLAEPAAARLLADALGLCPTGKLLAASDGHSYPEMHWWGATVWRRALGEVLGVEVRAGRLDLPAATAVARDVLGGTATRLYRL
jgi:uncharacterized protein